MGKMFIYCRTGQRSVFIQYKSLKINNKKMTKSQTVNISDLTGQIKTMKNTHIKK